MIGVFGVRQPEPSEQHESYTKASEAKPKQCAAKDKFWGVFCRGVLGTARLCNLMTAVQFIVVCIEKRMLFDFFLLLLFRADLE